MCEGKEGRDSGGKREERRENTVVRILSNRNIVSIIARKIFSIILKTNIIETFIIKSSLEVFKHILYPILNHLYSIIYLLFNILYHLDRQLISKLGSPVV